MTRNVSVSESETKSVTSRASDLVVLNDEECKRILDVVERDFQLRQKEYQRLEELRKLAQEENERAKYLADSKEFNDDHCIRCFGQFRFILKWKEKCSECGLFVCRDCATYAPEAKTWACKTCLKLKELEALTSNWFYQLSSLKHKRCGSAKVIRDLHKREKELAELDEYADYPGRGTFPTGSLVSYVTYDKNVARELKEYSSRLTLLLDKLEADLAERNIQNNHRTIRGKSKESLKNQLQELATEIGRARVAVSGPLRRSIEKPTATFEQDLQGKILEETEKVLQAQLPNFRKALSEPNSSINANNFDQKLAQAIFDKCVSREIFQELPDVIDSSAPSVKSQRQSSNTSSLTSLTKPSSVPPTWSNISPRTSTASWEIKSRNDNIRKISIPKDSAINVEDTEKEDDEGREQITNAINSTQALTITETIQFDNGLKLDLSSIDDETSNTKNNQNSVDSDFEAINRSISRVGEWQTNFTLAGSKPSSYSGEETSRSNRGAVYVTIPVADKSYSSPRIGDKPLEELADDDLYADDESSSYPIPINTATIADQSQISDNESTNIRKLFPLPANLLLQNHSSCSFRRPSYTYESDNESLTSSVPSLADMKTLTDEDRFRMDPNIPDPKFTLRPKDITIRAGETAKFKVKVMGTSPIDVFWFRFGSDDEIVNDEKYQLSHDDTYHYLKIFSTKSEDQGAYLCVIANDKAQNVDMVKLFVKDNKRSFNAPKVLQSFVDTDVNEGSPLTLRCKIDQGYPKARVLWYKEGTLIQPNGHYKLYYYGDGQHALHVDETTIEDDNGTFTCLALNAAGRVQITADVFVHEKEVIDIPRESPIVKHHQRILRTNRTNKDISKMSHNEDEPPTISPSIPPLTRSEQSDNEEQEKAKRIMDKFKNDRSSKLLESWKALYETSIHSLQSDDDLQKPVAKQPFFLNREITIESPTKELPRSPEVEHQSKSSLTKSKWTVRAPELLNTTVGPDRQRRDLSRRHTTMVILPKEQGQPVSIMPQQKNSNPPAQNALTPQTSNEADNARPSSPLVKHLKQKFDRMTLSSQASESTKLQSQSQTDSSKVHRVGHDEGDGACPLLPDDEYDWVSESADSQVASLTCRGLTSNNGDRPIQKPRPMLPIRQTTQTTPVPQNSNKAEPTDANMPTTIDQHQRGKTSPPVSYSNHPHPSRPATSVVKDIIGGGATLVYDSLFQENSPHATANLIQQDFYANHQYQQQRKKNVRTEQSTQDTKINFNNKINTNENLLKLTGRQYQSNFSINTTTINTKNQNHSTNSDNDEPKRQPSFLSAKDSLNRSLSMSDNFSTAARPLQKNLNGGASLDSNSRSSTTLSSITSGGKNSVLARAELWDRRICTTENDTTSHLTSYDIEQWSNEFEKVQNQL